jgi:hypothetical protein
MLCVSEWARLRQGRTRPDRLGRSHAAALLRGAACTSEGILLWGLKEQPRLQLQQRLQPRLLQDRLSKRRPVPPQCHLKPHPRPFYTDLSNPLVRLSEPLG